MQDRQFTFWGYSATNDGTYTLDGVKYDLGTDFRTVERYREYKDAGRNVLFPQLMAQYSEPYGQSMLKKTLDDALTAGIDRVIVNDRRIQELSECPGGIVGEGEITARDGKSIAKRKFPSEAELDAYIAECLAPYADHPAFYGVMVCDEPNYKQLISVGEVYRAVKRVREKTYVQCCLGPPVPAMDTSYVPEFTAVADKGEMFDHWKKYLRDFVAFTGADYIMYDHYPINDVYGVYPSYILGLQIAAGICKELGVSLRIVTQSCYMKQRAAIAPPLKEADLRYLTNMIVGFGADTVAYFTYFTKQANKTGYEVFCDGGSFINRDGSRTEIYGYCKQIHSELQKLAPEILACRYNASTVVKKDGFCFFTDAAAVNAVREKFDGLKGAETDKETALITELIDPETHEYMYMVQNIVNPKFSGPVTFETVTLDFGDGCRAVEVFEKGEKTVLKTENGKIKFGLYPGCAVFVKPKRR